MVFASAMSGGAGAGGREGAFRGVLGESTGRVDLQGLRRLCGGGVPDAPAALRATAWKCLLGLLPPALGDWEGALAARRAQYADYCREFIRVPGDAEGGACLWRTTPWAWGAPGRRTSGITRCAIRLTGT